MICFSDVRKRHSIIDDTLEPLDARSAKLPKSKRDDVSGRGRGRGRGAKRSYSAMSKY